MLPHASFKLYVLLEIIYVQWRGKFYFAEAFKLRTIIITKLATSSSTASFTNDVYPTNFKWWILCPYLTVIFNYAAVSDVIVAFCVT